LVLVCPALSFSPVPYTTLFRSPFSVAIRASGAELVRVPLREFAFDLKVMAKTITPKTGVIYLANPNNPTGSAFGREDFDEFLARSEEHTSELQSRVDLVCRLLL